MKSRQPKISTSVKKVLKVTTVTIFSIIASAVALSWLLYTVVPAPRNDPSDLTGVEKHISDADISTESDRLESLALDIEALATTDVMMRHGITFGRQIIIDATSDSDNEELLKEVLLDLHEIAWNNKLYVPSEVRVSIIDANGVVIDATSLDYPRHGVGSDYLYDNFGPPAANPEWRP